MIATAVVSGGATAVVLISPQLRLVSGRPEQKGALEATAALIALLAGSVAFARLRRRETHTDFALACALAVIALSNLFFAAIPALAGLAVGNAAGWSAIIGRSAGGLLFGAAAFAPARAIRRPGRALVTAAFWVAGGLALTVLFVWAWRTHLPAVGAASAARSATRSPPHTDAPLFVLEMVVAVVYCAAAVGFLHASRRLKDEFFGWLAIAAVFAAVSNLNYFIYPSLYTRMVSVGDAFRVCFYAVLLVASIREIWSCWLAVPEAMVNERRRIACDLHDGLAQELAYLTRHLDALDGNVEQETLSRLRQATERAQLESRLAITGLAVAGQPAVTEAVARAATETAGRFGVELELDLLPGIRLPEAHSQALIRIACEAITNAARHSGTTRVNLSLQRLGARVRLRVADSGSGFEPAKAAGGFGLTSMRERASSVGGELRISSRPGGGTEVEAIL